MPPVTFKQWPRLDRAFARMVRRILLWVGTVSLIACTVANLWLLNRSEEQAAAAQARLFAACLFSDSGTELWTAFDALQSRYGSLAAVATIAVSGQLDAVYPSPAAYHAACTAALDEAGGPVATTEVVNGQRKRFWAVVVPFNGDTSPDARRIVLVLKRKPKKIIAATASLGFGLAILFTLSVGFLAATYWFDRRVIRPLRRLGTPFPVDGKTGHRVCRLDAGGWCETERIAESLRAVSQRLEAEDTHNRMTDRRTKRAFDDRRRALERRLRRAEDRARRDPLTGLWNRTFLDEELEALVEHHVAGNKPLAAAMIDVDNFKGYNDTFGHKAGDALLRFIAELLQASIRPGDQAVRYGGDEFFLLLPGVDAAQAAHIVARIVKLFRQFAAGMEGGHDLSLSAGVASLAQEARGTGDDLVQAADRSLYKAKRSGKNVVSTRAAVDFAEGRGTVGAQTP